MLRALFAAVLLLVPLAASAQTLNVTTDPPGAKIYRVERSGVRTLLGTGLARFKVEKDQPNTLLVEAAGFAPFRKDFPRGEKYPKDLKVALENRLVKVTALPYDAKVRLNGNEVGTGAETNSIIVPKGTIATLEVVKEGFKTETRIYRNLGGDEVIPESEHIELKDRVVRVLPAPADARVVADGSALPLNDRGEALVVVPVDRCTNVQVVAAAYQPVEKRFCNDRSQAQGLDLQVRLALLHRITKVHTTPASAQIAVGNRVAGVGDFAVTTPWNTCVQLSVTAPAYVASTKDYCNKPDSANYAMPPADDNVVLTPDDAYQFATQSDQANVNFTVEVNPKKTMEQAWSTISLVVLNKFDVLEGSDRASGYMRTAWQANYYPHTSVRTRVIVKIGSDVPLKYIVKINSEHADTRANVKDDDQFKEWNYILNTYKDIINEIQSRLR